LKKKQNLAMNFLEKKINHWKHKKYENIYSPVKFGFYFIPSYIQQPSICSDFFILLWTCTFAVFFVFWYFSYLFKSHL
jgi:hypothetical protein